MLSPLELVRLRKACDKLDNGPDYRCKDYVANLLNTAIDFQMKSEVVNAAMEYFEETHGARTHRRLVSLIALHLNTKKGNLNLANLLWNNNHWSRAKFLRKIVEGFEERGVRGQKSLENWVKNADFETDVKGRFKTKEHSIGYTLFLWLQLRCGVNTVKPDVHIVNFVSKVFRRRVSPEEAVAGLKKVAKDSKRKAYRLDSAIWHFQRDYPR